MEPTPLSHDFWLVLAAFVAFVLAALGLPYLPPGSPPPSTAWPWRLNLLGLGAALLSLALLWR